MKIVPIEVVALGDEGKASALLATSMPKRGAVGCSEMTNHQPPGGDLGGGEIEADEDDVRREVGVEEDACVGGDGRRPSKNLGGNWLGWAHMAMTRASGYRLTRVAADDEDDAALGAPFVGLDVGGERGLRETVDGLSELVGGFIPEAFEVGAARWVGGVAAPEELASHLVAEADEEGLGEAGVGFEEGDEVGLGDGAEAGDEPVAVVGIEGLVHGAGGTRGRP